MDINWDIEKETFSSRNGPKEELIVNIDLLTQTKNCVDVNNLNFSLSQNEFRRFYSSLTKLRTVAMT